MMTAIVMAAACNGATQNSIGAPVGSTMPTSIGSQPSAVAVTGRYRVTFVHRDWTDLLTVTVRQKGLAVSGSWVRENGEGGALTGSVDASPGPFGSVNLYISNDDPVADYYHVVGTITARDAALIEGTFLYVGVHKGPAIFQRE
jgi:hypothetical protein